MGNISGRNAGDDIQKGRTSDENSDRPSGEAGYFPVECETSSSDNAETGKKAEHQPSNRVRIGNISGSNAGDLVQEGRRSDENPDRPPGETRCLPNECETSGSNNADTADCIVDISTMMVVSKHIGKDYRNLGRVLSVSVSEMETIEMNETRLGTQEMAYQIIDTWKKKEGDKATRLKLVQFLDEIHRHDIGQQIKKPPIKNGEQSSQTQQTETNQNESTFLSDLQTRLRDSYKRIVLKGLPWMKEVRITLRDFYVELMMIEQDENGVDRPKKPIQLDEMFDASNRIGLNKSRILVEGGPGYGKTTFGYKLCYDFAQSVDYVKHFDIVFLLPLREFCGDLQDMLVKVSGVSEREKAFLFSLFNSQSIKTLVILEGFDELPVEHRPVVLSLIKGKSFPHVTVIVSSRPGMFENESRRGSLLTSRDTSIFTNLFTVRIRIIGISETKLGEFIEKHLTNFSSEQKNSVSRQLKEVIEKNVVTKSFLQCPLFLLMVILLFTEKVNETQQQLQSKTDLYKQVMQFVVRRYLIKTGTKFCEFSDLFSFDFAQRPLYVDAMIRFGQFSVEALKSSKLTFSADDVVRYSSEVADIADLGLLNKTITVEGFYNKSHYEPVHKSLMEFAVAYFLWTEFSTSPHDVWTKNVSSFRPKLGNESSLVFVFLAGLMKDDAFVIFQALEPYAAEFNSCFSSLIPSLLEVQLTSTLLSSLLPLLPTAWYLLHEDDEFSSFSPQCKQILDFGLKKGKIKEIVWYSDLAVSLPDDVKVTTMKLFMNNNFTALSECQYKSITCTDLHCQFDEFRPSSNIWPIFIYLLPSIRFQRISYSFYGSSSSFFLPLLHSDMLTGSQRSVNIHRIFCVLRDEKSSGLEIIADLVQRERVGGLWLQFRHRPLLCNTKFQLFQQQVDSLVSYASTSCILLNFALDNFHTTNPIIDMVQMCNKGQKTWEGLRLSNVNVQVNSTEEVQIPDLYVQNLWIDDLNPTCLASHLLQSCLLTALCCRSTFLTSFLYPEHLTELDIIVDELVFKEGFQDSVRQLENLQVLALTLESFDHRSPFISIEEWFLQSISHAYKLKGLEIRRVENNFYLATDLVHAVVKYLGERMLESFLPETDTLLSSSVTQEPKLHYVLLYCPTEFKDTNSRFQFISLASSMKESLREKLLVRLDIVQDVNNYILMPMKQSDDSTSLSDVFSTEEGFRFEHNFWGMREDDSLYARQLFEFLPFLDERISISFVKTNRILPSIA